MKFLCWIYITGLWKFFSADIFLLLEEFYKTQLLFYWGMEIRLIYYPSVF